MSVEGSGRPQVAGERADRHRVEAEDRRGLRQAVAFLDVLAGERLPLRRGRRRSPPRRRRSRPCSSRSPPRRSRVHAVSPLEERVDAGEDRELRVLDRVSTKPSMSRGLGTSQFSAPTEK